MSDQSGPVAIFEAEDGILLWGSAADMAELDAMPGFQSASVLGSRELSRVGNALDTASKTMVESGRWLRLDDKSAEFIRTNKVRNVTAGVIRRKDIPGAKGGQVAKHLGFESAVMPSPGALGSVSALVTQMAIQASLDEIKEYLEEIDAKLDKLIRERKTDAVGTLSGVSMALDEAETINAETGAVSAVTWSKVQQGTMVLMTLQADAVARLNALADDVRAAGKDVDRTARAVKTARAEAPFWLGILARAIALQDRQYVLELGRVADESPDSVEAHRRGITVARRDRHERIANALVAIQESLNDGASLTTMAYVANPLTSQAVIRGANAVGAEVERFARGAGLDVTLNELAGKTWLEAARELPGELVDSMQETGKGVARTVRRRVDDAVLGWADRIKEQRGDNDVEVVPSSHPESSDVGEGDGA